MGRLYKPAPPVSFLERIELILNPQYKADEQTVLKEVNLDTDNVPFEMKRIIKCDARSRYVLYKFDCEPKDDLYPFPYFNLKDANGIGLGVAKVCDYVMFVERDEESFILLIELKKGMESPIHQLEQMQFFVKFIQVRAEYAGINIDAQIRKIGITEQVSKDLTKMGNNVCYDENGFVQLYGGVYFWLRDLVK
ncbi:MAG: hypothetical protein KBT39_01255 [Bacteroidales bacterium]|nr:hypothetical protein [Bacteroidales bacterium]